MKHLLFSGKSRLQTRILHQENIHAQERINVGLKRKNLIIFHFAWKFYFYLSRQHLLLFIENVYLKEQKYNPITKGYIWCFEPWGFQ